MNFSTRSLFITLIHATLGTSLLLVSGCVTDPGVSKKRSLVTDFSIANNTLGCDAGYIVISKPDMCAASCGTDTGYHLATDAELTKVKETADPALLAKIAAAAGVCIDDIPIVPRPTNQIDIRSDFCSCIDGKSDIISDCTAYCSTAAVSASPTLYVNTIMGADIALNTKLGNLENWCSVKLDGDTTNPQCFLSAFDGINTIANIPMENISGNSFTANIQVLALDKTYILKIVETKTGTNAQSKEFQIRRKTQTVTDNSMLGALKLTPINQYTCMTYGGSINSTTGQMLRTSYARVFYYFAANESPPPVPPVGGNAQSPVVCHDEQLHPGNDSAEYPRLEMIPQLFAMWDKYDPRFVSDPTSEFVINKILETRLLSEYGIQAKINLFILFPFPNRPTTSGATATTNPTLGYIMVPFSDSTTGKIFCPTQANFNTSGQPLYNVLKDYMDDTEALYTAEKEAETIQLDGTNYKTIYGTMLVTESIVKKYGFYIENGFKIKADETAMNTKTIYYYWPTNTTMDPLTQGNRKLFTIRSPDSLNGNTPGDTSKFKRTPDKRIGCVPKSAP